MKGLVSSLTTLRARFGIAAGRILTGSRALHPLPPSCESHQAGRRSFLAAAASDGERPGAPRCRRFLRRTMTGKTHSAGVVPAAVARTLGSALVDCVGNTPLLRLERVGAEFAPIEFYAKAEW